MSRIEQTAGGCSIVAYTDGAPIWPELEIVANNGEAHVIRVSVAHLHDLRYCIDRVLARLKADGGAGE